MRRGLHSCRWASRDPPALLLSGLLGAAQRPLLDSVRFASKKAGGSSKNLGGKSPGRRFGFKKQDGNDHYSHVFLITC